MHMTPKDDTYCSRHCRIGCENIERKTELHLMYARAVGTEDTHESFSIIIFAFTLFC